VPTDGVRVGWSLKLYPDAGEASLRLVSPARSDGDLWRGDGADSEVDPGRSEFEAARRARGQVRRYCAANGLNRLGTLTYRGDGCFDPVAVRGHLGEFFRSLRQDIGVRRLAYVWVPEWHRSHGIHVHFAVGRYVKRCKIEQAWGRGFVHIKLIGNLPVGSGVRAEARRAGRYLAKYAGKDFDHEHLPGLHRYDVGQGFQPRVEYLAGSHPMALFERATRRMGSAPGYIWSSAENPDWYGPPVQWMSWDR
jgi:hypothetical protein